MRPDKYFKAVRLTQLAFAVTTSKSSLPSEPGTKASTAMCSSSNPWPSPSSLRQETTIVADPLPDVAPDDQATGSFSSINPSSSLASPSHTTSCTPTTQATSSSQTSSQQNQRITSHRQLSFQPENLWNDVFESKRKSFQREGSSQSDRSCATTEPASREPSPALHEDRDPTLPVPVPQMPRMGNMLGRTNIGHPPPGPISPRSHALSIGLKERDFAYEDHPGKVEHQKALAEKKMSQKSKTEFVDHPCYQLNR